MHIKTQQREPEAQDLAQRSRLFSNGRPHEDIGDAGACSEHCDELTPLPVLSRSGATPTKRRFRTFGNSSTLRALPMPMGLAVVWSKGEKLRPVNAQPVALVAPARTLSLDECPEPS